ncbi:hypothetical protein SK128_005483 [Halocaridina rubra]|uniref:Uncharacterized protein n=1 Tax=Halocaridina rubra TaxID=373956 RepID=A0AAN8WQN0_HALRR
MTHLQNSLVAFIIFKNGIMVLSMTSLITENKMCLKLHTLQVLNAQHRHDENKFQQLMNIKVCYRLKLQMIGKQINKIFKFNKAEHFSLQQKMFITKARNLPI